MRRNLSSRRRRRTGDDRHPIRVGGHGIGHLLLWHWPGRTVRCPPFTQWIQVLPYWSTNWWVMFWVIIAAVGATGLIGLILIICLGLSRGLRQAKSLYGLTGWATTRQMADGGLKLRNKL